MYEWACLAPGATVDGQPRDCVSVNADCADVSQQECDTLMSVLTEQVRQQAYERYFRDTSGQPCRTVFDDCIGLPRQ